MVDVERADMLSHRDVRQRSTYRPFRGLLCRERCSDPPTLALASAFFSHGSLPKSCRNTAFLLRINDVVSMSGGLCRHGRCVHLDKVKNGVPDKQIEVTVDEVGACERRAPKPRHRDCLSRCHRRNRKMYRKEGLE